MNTELAQLKYSVVNQVKGTMTKIYQVLEKLNEEAQSIDQEVKDLDEKTGRLIKHVHSMKDGPDKEAFKNVVAAPILMNAAAHIRKCTERMMANKEEAKKYGMALLGGHIAENRITKAKTVEEVYQEIKNFEVVVKLAMEDKQ